MIMYAYQNFAVCDVHGQMPKKTYIKQDYKEFNFIFWKYCHENLSFCRLMLGE